MIFSALLGRRREGTSGKRKSGDCLAGGQGSISTYAREGKGLQRLEQGEESGFICIKKALTDRAMRSTDERW